MIIRILSPSTPELFRLLYQKQRETGYSDERFVKEMLPGVSRSSYRAYFKDPDNIPCPAIFTAILNSFPDLTGEVIDYLKQGRQ